MRLQVHIVQNTANRRATDSRHNPLCDRLTRQVLARPRGDVQPFSHGFETGQLNDLRLMDEQSLKTPFYGSRRMGGLAEQSRACRDRKRIQRLMRLMGLEAIYPRPRTSLAHPSHKIYPYLLRDLAIIHPHQVWSTDITYIPMPQGFMYLVAIMDWYRRSVLSWRLSNTREGRFCLEALEEALDLGKPRIFNSDQGVQFTGLEFTGRLEAEGIAVSHDGRALDNVFVERLWRSVKYEDVYIKGLWQCR
jgi:putative transposase